MTTEDLISYYKALLILQYASLGNALGTVDAFIGELIQDQIIDKVRNAFDLDTAIGRQLDILGTYRGINRVVFGAAPGNFWSLVPYSDALPGSYFGWAEYNDPVPSWLWEQYHDLDNVSYALSDSQMRRLIKFKALVDSWDGTLGGLDNILYLTFGAEVFLMDNEDMSIIYQHILADPDPDHLFEIAVLAGTFPNPAGVSFTTVEI